MVYAKYITRTGKDGRKVRYGPYYYRSIRTPDGKIRNVYLGSKPVPNKKKKQKENKMNLRQLKDMLAGVF